MSDWKEFFAMMKNYGMDGRPLPQGVSSDWCEKTYQAFKSRLAEEAEQEGKS